jgi:hypothetical protein
MTSRGKFTPETAAAIVKSIEAGIAPERAARREGVAPGTLTRWRNEGESEPEGIYGDFAAAVGRAEAHMIGKVERALYAAIDKGDTRAAMWWLSKKVPAEYGEKVVLDETSALVSTPMSQEAKDAVQVALQKVRADRLRAEAAAKERTS